jgi:hypothetical protein
MRSLDWRQRRARYIAAAGEQVTKEVLAKARTLLG